MTTRIDTTHYDQLNTENEMISEIRPDGSVYVMITGEVDYDRTFTSQMVFNNFVEDDGWDFVGHDHYYI